MPSTTYDIYEPNHFNLNLQQAITPITKWGWTVSNTDMIVNVLNRAISMALSPPRGPQVQNVYCRTLHPLSLGFFDIREPKIKEQIAKSDALLFIGSRATYARIIGCLPEKCTVIEVNTNPAEVGKYHRVDIPVVGNLHLTLEILCHHTRVEIENRNLSRILSDRKQSLVEKINDYKREKKEKLAAVSMKNGPITGIQLIKAMKETLPRDTVIVDDSQCMGYYLKHYYDFHEPHTKYDRI